MQSLREVDFAWQELLEEEEELNKEKVPPSITFHADSPTGISCKDGRGLSSTYSVTEYCLSLSISMESTLPFSSTPGSPITVMVSSCQMGVESARPGGNNNNPLAAFESKFQQAGYLAWNILTIFGAGGKRVSTYASRLVRR
jgi:hypothetical protein